MRRRRKKRRKRILVLSSLVYRVFVLPMSIEEVKVRIEEVGNHQSFVHSWLIVLRTLFPFFVSGIATGIFFVCLFS